MASYIQGLTDYIPQIQPFKPDLNLYASILQVKEQQTEQGRKRFGALYGSLLNAPLSGPDNIKRRDDFFKMIDQDIKKVSGMDLSLPQNQQIAASIFEPLINDKAIAHDMVFTKQSQTAMQRGDMFKYCTDPAKCGGEYWDEGMAYINYKLQDYAKATPEQRLKMSAPDFNPRINMVKEAMEWTKAQGLVVESVSQEGGYLVTRQNGKQMQIPLQQIYTAIYGNDSKIQAMYNTSAYVKGKQYIQQNLQNYNNDENLAEEAWFKEVLDNTGESLLKQQKAIEVLSGKSATKKQALEAKIKRDGISKEFVTDDPLYQDYITSTEDDSIGKVANKYYQDLLENLKNIDMDPNNRAVLRDKINAIVANGMLQESIFETATLYADTHSAVTKIEADPFTLEYVKHQYQLAENMQNHRLDYEKSVKLKMFDMSKDMATYMISAGFGNGANGEQVQPDSDQSIGPGSSNMLETTQNKYLEGTTQSGQLEYEYVNSILNKADLIISNPNSSGAEIENAKNIKQDILGKNYNRTNNTYIKNGVASSKWGTTGFTDNERYNQYSNALNVFNQNSSLFSAQEKNKLMNLKDDHSRYWAMKTAGMETLKDNATSIYNGIDADVNIADKTEFKQIFKRLPDGRYFLKNEQDYVQERKGSPNARADYAKQLARFNAIYNSGGSASMPIRSIEGTRIGNADGGVTSFAKIRYSVDSQAPALPGTSHLMSLRNDIYKFNAASGKAENYEKVLIGGNYSSEEYEDMETSPEAAKLLKYYFNDFNKMYATPSDKMMSPKGTLHYKGTAANNPNLEAYVIHPNIDWLNSYADKKTNKIFGVSVDDWYTNGITVYKNKNESRTTLTKENTQHPFTALVATGRPIVIQRPDAGSLVLQQTGNSVSLNGTVDKYYRDANGKFFSEKLPVNKTWDITNNLHFSPGMIYAEAIKSMDYNSLINNGIKFNNAAGKEYDPVKLTNQYLNNEFPRQDFMNNLSEQYQQQLQMTNDMFNMIQGNGGR